MNASDLTGVYLCYGIACTASLLSIGPTVERMIYFTRGEERGEGFAVRVLIMNMAMTIFLCAHHVPNVYSTWQICGLLNNSVLHIYYVIELAGKPKDDSFGLVGIFLNGAFYSYDFVSTTLGSSEFATLASAWPLQLYVLLLLELILNAMYKFEIKNKIN